MLTSLLLAALLAPPVAPPAPHAAITTAEDGRGQALFTAAWHAGRRAALMEGIEEGVVVLRGAGAVADYDTFRQDNDFWYFTGIETPGAVLVLVSDGREYLFVPPVSAGAERWVGDLTDPEEARERTGIAHCLPLGAKGPPDMGGLEDLLGQLSLECTTFHTPRQPAQNRMMGPDTAGSAARAVQRDPYDGRETREERFAARLAERHGVKVEDVTPLIDRLRLVKTAPEIEALRRACRISGLAHEHVMRSAVPGEYEWQLAARMTGDFLAEGAAGPAYGAIVGSGPRACILHYGQNDRALGEGEVVLIDYGCEYRFFCADITRSWPTARRFTDRQREVYEAVLAAQDASFAACRPGATLPEVEGAASRAVQERGFGQMWHGTSHWIGMATHDVGGRGGKLVPGIVFTVEPGIYLPEEGFGIRIEDMVLITEDGYELLSSMVPRTVAEIEALRATALQGDAR